MKLLPHLFFAVFALSFTCVNAQKLPGIQENSLWAPDNVKIDARLNDWGDKLQAYNKTLGIYYTLANDDKNLYLVVKATDQAIKNKISGGGIDLTINTEGKKSKNGAYVISFPLIDSKNMRSQMSLMGKPMDSTAIANARKQVIKTFKEIKLTGFKDITDNVISIYNQYGIKALADIDDKNSLICEYAIPLKYFSENATSTGFVYNLKLNGIDLNAMMGGRISGPIGIELAPGSPARLIGNPLDTQSPTDFWSKYTLAKK